MSEGRHLSRASWNRHVQKYKQECCFTCEKTSQLHAHHIDQDFTNESPDNIITLCASCHSIAHGKGPGWVVPKELRPKAAYKHWPSSPANAELDPLVNALIVIQQSNNWTDSVMGARLGYDRRSWNMMKNGVYHGTLRNLAVRILHVVDLTNEYPHLSRLAADYLANGKSHEST